MQDEPLFRIIKIVRSVITDCRNYNFAEEPVLGAESLLEGGQRREEEQFSSQPAKALNVKLAPADLRASAQLQMNVFATGGRGRKEK